MADNFIKMQHASEGPAGFTSGRFSAESDEDGFLDVPSYLAAEAKAHGFVAVSAKSVKVLAKSAKGVEEETGGDGAVKAAEPEKGKEAAPAQKGAKSAKGGAE